MTSSAKLAELTALQHRQSAGWQLLQFYTLPKVCLWTLFCDPVDHGVTAVLYSISTFAVRIFETYGSKG